MDLNLTVSQRIKCRGNSVLLVCRHKVTILVLLWFRALKKMAQLVGKKNHMPVSLPGARKDYAPSKQCTHLLQRTHLVLMSSYARLPAAHHHQLVQTKNKKENKHH